jgi:hypothetical protein
LEALKKVKDLVNEGLDKGFRVPIVRSALSHKPSITLTFPYVTFVLSLISLTVYHYQALTTGKDLLIPVVLTLSHFAISMIFYLMRSINKAKIDFDDKELELSNNGSKGEENE